MDTTVRQQPVAAPSPAPLSEGFAISLDSLLAESLTEAAAARDVKASREALAKGGLPASERDAIAAQVRSWELRREWLPRAAVVMFSRQCCKGCGQFHTQFLGWFQRQEHRQSKVSRWVPGVRPVDSALPREAKYQDNYAEICEDCAEHLGFDVEE